MVNTGFFVKAPSNPLPFSLTKITCQYITCESNLQLLMRYLRLGNRNCVSFLIFKWCLSFQGQWDLQSQKAEPYIMNLKMLLKTFFFWLPHGGKSSREQYFSNSLPNRMQEVLSSCGSPQASDQQHKHTQYLRSKSRQVYLTNPHKAKNQIDNNKRERKIKTN